MPKHSAQGDRRLRGRGFRGCGQRNQIAVGEHPCDWEIDRGPVRPEPFEHPGPPRRCDADAPERDVHRREVLAMPLVYPRTSSRGREAFAELDGTRIDGEVRMSEMVFTETSQSGVRILNRFPLAASLPSGWSLGSSAETVRCFCVTVGRIE
jgi:hypothetical protein